MKKVASVVCALLVFLFCSSNVMAADTKGIYFGLVGGYVIPTGIGGAILDPADGSSIFPDYDPTMKNGYLYGAKVGWLTPFTNRILALELEYNHITNDFDKAKNFLPGLDAELNSKINIDLIMFNMIARYPNGRFHPYVGVGAGYAYAKINDIEASYEGDLWYIFDGGSKGVFAYQGIAGIDFDITKNIIIGLAYKYIGLQKISFDSNLRDSDGIILGATVTEVNYRSHNVTLSLSYMF